MTLLHEFIFVFIRYFIGAILPKNIAKSVGLKKKQKGEDGYIEAELFIQGV